MPPPDEPSPATTHIPPDEKLSGTEKHWNQITLALLAIGTTVLGVALAVTGISREGQGGSPDLKLAQLMFAGIALGTYWFTFFHVVTCLFQPRSPDPASRVIRKRRAATGAVAAFGSLLMAASLRPVYIQPID